MLISKTMKHEESSQLRQLMLKRIKYVRAKLESKIKLAVESGYIKYEPIFETGAKYSWPDYKVLQEVSIINEIRKIDHDLKGLWVGLHAIERTYELHPNPDFEK